MSALPTHIGGLQALAEHVETLPDDIFVHCGMVRSFLGEQYAGQTVGAIQQDAPGWNIYRRIPVAKQGDCDTSGWKKVAEAACPTLSPAAAESVQRLKDAICAPVKTVEVTMRGGENEGKRIRVALPTDAKAATYDDGKPPLASLPPEGLLAVARVQAYGKRKYGDDENYRKGMEAKRQMSCVLRHVFKYLAGEDNDNESGEPHLAHAAARLLFAIQNIAEGVMIDDRYKGGKK